MGGRLAGLKSTLANTLPEQRCVFSERSPLSLHSWNKIKRGLYGAEHAGGSAVE